MDRAAWWATVHGVTKSRTQLKRMSMHAYLTYNVVLVSGFSKMIQLYIHILFHILFHYGLLKDIEYSSLCCTVGPVAYPFYR